MNKIIILALALASFPFNFASLGLCWCSCAVNWLDNAVMDMAEAFYQIGRMMSREAIKRLEADKKIKETIHPV